jgi:hypothetical protein
MKWEGALDRPNGTDSEFVLAVSCPESRLVDVRFLYPELVVALLEINFGEHRGASFSNPVQEFINPGERVTVLDRDVVECTVVNAHAESAVLLADKQHRCTKLRC